MTNDLAVDWGVGRGRSIWTYLRTHGAQVGLIVVLLASAGIFTSRWQSPQPVPGDTYWYLRNAERLAGIPDATAERDVAVVHCRHLAMAVAAGVAPEACHGLTPPGCPPGGYVCHLSSPRYQAIFTSRPGYPLVVAALRSVTDLGTAVLVATAALYLLAAGLAYWLGGLLDVAPPGAAMLALFWQLTPAGYYAAQMQADGCALATTILVLVGAALVLRHRRRPGIALAAVGLAATLATKSSQGVLDAGVLAVAGILTLAAFLVVGLAKGVARRPDLTPAVLLIALGTAGLLGWFVVSSMLGLPSLTETAQDLATRHFTRPDVADPFDYVRRFAVGMWQLQIPRVLGMPWPTGPALLASAVLLWTRRTAALPVVGAGLGSFALATIHPMFTEYPRLIVVVWILVAAACAVVVDLVTTWMAGLIRPRRPSRSVAATV